MKRTKSPTKQLTLPDAINCSLSKNFTQVPNTLLRNPGITAKSKAILCLLLSNKEGWHSHMNTIKQMLKENDGAIQSGLQELERTGYLQRIKYRDKKTKVWKGSFWAYTDIPFQFNVKEHLEILERMDLEPQPGFPDVGFPDVENQGLIIHNNKKTNKDTFSKDKKPTKKERNQTYLPLAQQLSQIISSSKNIKHNMNQVQSWSDEIRRLCESGGVKRSRVQIVLDWYGNNIGGEYIPVVESGSSLRQKFTRLEDAMNRKSYNSKPKMKIAYGEKWYWDTTKQAYINEQGRILDE